MKHITKQVGFCVLSLMVGGFSTITLAASEATAGNTIRVIGVAHVKGSNGKIRTLTDNTAINVGDIVTTEKEASVQMQMKDGAIVALTGESEFKVLSYNYQEAGGQKDNVKLSLKKGRLRTITGSTPKTAYSLSTNTAIVRIHGTAFDALAKKESSTIILRADAVTVESTCEDTPTGNIQIVDVPGTSTEVALCQRPTEPEPDTGDTSDLDAILPKTGCVGSACNPSPPSGCGKNCPPPASL